MVVAPAAVLGVGEGVDAALAAEERLLASVGVSGFVFVLGGLWTALEAWPLMRLSRDNAVVRGVCKVGVAPGDAVGLVVVVVGVLRWRLRFRGAFVLVGHGGGGYKQWEQRDN